MSDTARSTAKVDADTEFRGGLTILLTGLACRGPARTPCIKALVRGPGRVRSRDSAPRHGPGDPRFVRRRPSVRPAATSLHHGVDHAR